MIRRQFLLAALASAFIASLAFAEAPATAATPLEVIRDTLDKVITVVEKYPGDAHQKARREHLREVINPRFDFDEMSKRSLGALWKERTSDEQKKFVAVFSNLLAKTYLAKIELVQRDTVKIDKEEVEEARAMVRTTITYKGEKFPLDYKMMKRETSWMVYDVVVENIGLVANYRNEFAGIIRKDGFDGLITQLEEKLAK